MLVRLLLVVVSFGLFFVASCQKPEDPNLSKLVKPAPTPTPFLGLPDENARIIRNFVQDTANATRFSSQETGTDEHGEHYAKAEFVIEGQRYIITVHGNTLTFRTWLDRSTTLTLVENWSDADCDGTVNTGVETGMNPLVPVANKQFSDSGAVPVNKPNRDYWQGAYERHLRKIFDHFGLKWDTAYG